ncbi:MAG: hypothetical protein NVS9B15_22560 [Acidobacteriaceae bacterium]
MSPEQAAGREVDFRTDQFSLGLMLYEMASGKQAFSRGSTVETLAAIVREEAPTLEAKIPPPLHWTIDRCLQKDPEQRYESTRDLYQDLKALKEHLSEAYSSTDMKATPLSSSTERRSLYASIALVLGSIVVFLSARSSEPQRADLSRMVLKPLAYDAGAKYWSPDGKSVVYASDIFNGAKLTIRQLNLPAATVLSSGEVNGFPVGWTGGGSQVIFLEQLDSYGSPWHIKKISSAGGAVEPVMDLDGFTTFGFQVSPDGKQAVIAKRGEDKKMQLWISNPVGSTPQHYTPTTFETENALFADVHFSPDGKSLLLVQPTGKEAEVWLLPLLIASGTPRRLFQGMRFGVAPFFSWMPDSRHVVVSFQQSPTDLYHLWYADTRSRSLVQLTMGPTGETRPVVSPDGKTVLFELAMSSSDVSPLRFETGPQRH